MKTMLELRFVRGLAAALLYVAVPACIGQGAGADETTETTETTESIETAAPAPGLTTQDILPVECDWATYGSLSWCYDACSNENAWCKGDCNEYHVNEPINWGDCYGHCDAEQGDCEQLCENFYCN